MEQSYRSKKASTNEALVLLIQQGDEKAFAQFYARHRTKMYFVAFDLLRDEDNAHDAVQELFAHVWQHAAKIDAGGNIVAYLYTVLRNRILTAMSRSKHMDEYIASYLAFEQQSGSSTEETVLARELEHLLDEKISQLPPKMREVYELSWRENLTNKEIARRMDISEGTVKQQKHHALRILRSKLQRLISLLF